MVLGLVIMMVLVKKHLGSNTPTNNFRLTSSSRGTQKHANKTLDHSCGGFYCAKRNSNPRPLSLNEVQSKLQVSSVITRLIFPYIIPYVHI